MADARPINYWALSPFGRIGHRLGWRWVFYFTFPIPYHPWLARALPLLAGAWVVWLALGPEEVHWTSPLWVALVLGALLSVPILQWILFAFRLHLIQAMMVPAALLLLGVAAVRGDLPRALAAVPALLHAAHAAAAIAGRRHIRAWQADNRRIEALRRDSGPLPPLLIRSEHHGQSHAARLLDGLGLPSVHYADRTGTMQALRIDDPDLIAWLDAVQDMRLDLFQMTRGREHRFLFLPAEPPADPWVIAEVPAGKARFVHGTVAGVRAEARGGPPVTYWHGRPAPLSWLPGCYCFVRLLLGMTAGFKMEAGLLPAAPRRLGADEGGAYAAVAATLRRDGPTPPPFADPAALRRSIQASLDRRLEPELSALDRLIADPANWMKRKLDTLLRLPTLYAARAEELVAALRVARDRAHGPAAVMLATLVAKLPDEDFQRVGDQLLLVINSKRLAGQVRIEPAVAGEAPRFEGLRLLIHVPQLYVRLAELGERARPMIEKLLNLLPRVEALQQAKAKLDAAAEAAAS